MRRKSVSKARYPGYATTVLKTARLLQLVTIGQRVDPTVPLLIRGEPGVGKDSLARLIHAASGRQPYSFTKVNCAARPVDRCEADLFGHERGASPVATRQRLGSFEFANQGTIYLDEIGALPHTSVPRLVQVLRTRTLARIDPEDLAAAGARERPRDPPGRCARHRIHRGRRGAWK